MLTSPDALAQRILQFVKRAIAEEMRDMQITLELKRDLDQYYRQCGASEVRYSDRENKNTEFMVDFCALKDRRLDTVLESEWNPNLDCIEYDFRKLLYFNAPLKVMVCDSPDYINTKLRAAVNFLGTRPCDYSQQETYMIVNWRGNRGVLNCHAWKPIETPVASENIKFRCIPGFPAVVSDKSPRSQEGWLGELD